MGTGSTDQLPEMADQVIDVLSGLSELDLRQGFESFVEAARRLEDSYGELKSRAEAIDLELAVTNKKLATTLSERETVFSAMPVGVAAVDVHGEISWCNPEARRLIAIASESGVDLTAAESGLLEMSQLAVNVNRESVRDDGIILVIEDRMMLVDMERQVHRLDRLACLS